MCYSTALMFWMNVWLMCGNYRLEEPSACTLGGRRGVFRLYLPQTWTNLSETCNVSEWSQCALTQKIGEIASEVPLTGAKACFWSTPPSRPNKVGLKRPSVRPSTKSFFDFNEIWCVGTGRRVMHDGMHHDPIQGQSHEPLKVGKSAIFKGYLPHL